ncbi:MAG: proline dehydrogenase family protein [Candidatus Kariarchaeaceae archaeon]|jgi:proline dehydrogenase
MKDFLVGLLPSFLVRIFARPYVSGNSIEKGVAKADELWNTRKITSTLDLLGEAVYTLEDVDRIVNTYLELINKIKGKEYTTVSVKPTAIGIHENYETCKKNLEKILEAGKKASIPITLDMEEHDYTDITLQLYRDLLPVYPNFGTVLQTRLFRTWDDITKLKDLKMRIRICIGIYKEDASIALTKKSEMKEELVKMTKQLIENGAFVEVATQDEETIKQILELAKEHGWTPENLEFQQLMGVPLKKVQNELLELGFVVRLYVPFATDWKYATPYLKRRLANNPKMAFYVLKHMVGMS